MNNLARASTCVWVNQSCQCHSCVKKIQMGEKNHLAFYCYILSAHYFANAYRIIEEGWSLNVKID